MFILFFYLFVSDFLFGSISHVGSSQSISDSSVNSSSGSIVRMRYRQNDPYNLYRTYKNKRPIPTHTKEWAKVIIK